MAVLGASCVLCALPLEHDHYVPSREPSLLKPYRGSNPAPERKFEPGEPFVRFGPERAWLRVARGLRQYGDGPEIVCGTVEDGSLTDAATGYVSSVSDEEHAAVHDATERRVEQGREVRLEQARKASEVGEEMYAMVRRPARRPRSLRRLLAVPVLAAAPRAEHAPDVTWCSLPPAMIQMFHVTKAYPGDAPVLVDINLDIEKGEFVFLTGPSGAGKSTLLKLIFLAERPTHGQILVAGRNVSRLRVSGIPYLRRNIGVVFQDFKLLARRTVAENVGFALEVLGVPRDEVRQRSLRMLRRVGLEHKAGVSPVKLSGGEQQRVALARALVNEPAVLLADEPTGNLDPELTLEIMDLLCDVNVRGTTVVVATHDASLIERYRKRTLRLEQGTLVADARGSRAAWLMARSA